MPWRRARHRRRGRVTKHPRRSSSIGDAIHTLLANGADPESTRFAQVQSQGVVDMMAVPDMGPKINGCGGADHSVEALRTAAAAGKLRDLKGFGAKSEEKILKGIELLAKREARRRRTDADRRGAPAGAAPDRRNSRLFTAGPIELGYRFPAGSLRRWKETIGDVDILCASAREPAR